MQPNQYQYSNNTRPINTQPQGNVQYPRQPPGNPHMQNTQGQY